MNILFIGAPGSGKGTQSRFFIEKHNFVQLSTGDLLRAAIAAKTETGLFAKNLMDQGKLVPDDVMIKLVEGYIKDNSTKSIIFDGFPRTVAQAEGLETMLKNRASKIDSVIYFKVNPQILIDRLTGRRTCSQCGEIYHIETKPSSKGSHCEKCGGTLTQRPDDRAEVISERLSQFEKNTGPTIDYYSRKGALVEIDSSKDPNEVFVQIAKVLKLAQ